MIDRETRRRRLELAMGLVHVPAVLFLDEPTLGLEEADALCDRVAIVHNGRLGAIDAPSRFKGRYHRDTLDEVFLALTGEQPAEQPPTDEVLSL